MKINDNILKELRSIAPTLASIEKINCYGVPEGYFSDGLPESFALNDLNITPAKTNKENSPFKKPETEDADLTYLNVISEILIEPYLHLKDKPLYKVPLHYFELLPTLILNEIKGEILLPNQLTQNTNSNSNYAIPDNYFSELQHKIFNRINSETLEDVELNALLQQMQHEQVYQVPAHYFANLGNRVLQQIKEPTVKEAKRVFLKPLQRVWAVAAALILFVGAFWLIQNNLQSNFNTENGLAQLSTQEIKTYIAENSYDFNENDLLQVNGNFEDDLFNSIEIQQEDIDFYLHDIDFNSLNDYYNNENTIDI